MSEPTKMAKENGDVTAEAKPGVPAKVEWRDPAPSRRGFGGATGVWEGRLAPLVTNPGRWAVVYTAEDGKVSKASGMAASLRGEKTKKPAGKWEFTSRGAEVFAKYIGPE